MRLDIKICGLKTPSAVDAALLGGATHVGFIFFPRSPRNVDAATAGALRQAALGRAKAVAVTVDASDAELDTIVAAMRPDLLQLHGAETPERVAAVRQRFALPVMKALAVRDAADLTAVATFEAVADRLLLDAKPPPGAALPGGNGLPFDWRLLRRLDAGLDYMLSGGIDAANVDAALSLAAPTGIDVSSGVESAPGVKDPARIAAFFGAVRTAQERAGSHAMEVGHEQAG
jgi:phosphoribosylanthranilate isomerase